MYLVVFNFAALSLVGFHIFTVTVNEELYTEGHSPVFTVTVNEELSTEGHSPVFTVTVHEELYTEGLRLFSQ